MSNKHLKKLHGAKDELSDLVSTLRDVAGEEDDSEDSDRNNDAFANKKPSVNLFQLLNDGDTSDENDTSPVVAESDDDEGGAAAAEVRDLPQTGTKPKKKGKKKKAKQQQQQLDADEEDMEDDDFLLAQAQSLNGHSGLSPAKQTKPISPTKNVLYLEQKSLNADNELKKIFGSRVVQAAGQKNKKARGRAYVKSTWLINAKDNWSQIRKTGLSMSIDRTKDGCIYFKYEHNKDYWQIQFQFLDAVASMNPANIVSIVNMYPHHIDSLIQLSDICRMGDDTQMAAELIERALYIQESAFHPSFNLASGNCRLEYRQQENRALFLAIFKHLVYIGQRSCNRTALEFCKLLYTLDIDADPLAVVLMIDYYALRAGEYAWFIEYFNTFEPVKNLSQLPNMAYGIALAYFYHAKHSTEETKVLSAKSDEYLQRALLMFPGVLMPLLDKCSIQADSRVTKHDYFSPTTAAGHPPSLNNLIQLYVGRSYHVWKDVELLPWLERNANKCLDEMERDPTIPTSCEEKRKTRYQGTPRNIYRHILLSDIKDATATLPRELADAPVMSFDPLPPIDSVSGYSRPTRAATSQQTAASQLEGGLLSSFFRSLMPGFNPNEVVSPAPTNNNNPRRGLDIEEDEIAPEGAGANLQRSVNTLVTAMRDLLSSIHLPDLGEPNDEDDDQDTED